MGTSIKVWTGEAQIISPKDPTYPNTWCLGIVIPALGRVDSLYLGTWTLRVVRT